MLHLHDQLLEWLHAFNMPFQQNRLLWKSIGFCGIAIFGSRTFVQWIYSERLRESRVPVLYWWLSVVGTVVCLSYAIRQKDSVFILMYTFNMIPYVRNLMLIRRRKTEAAATAALAADAPTATSISRNTAESAIASSPPIRAI